MQNFIQTAAGLAGESDIDPDTLAWAARAFACVAIVGGMESTNEDVGLDLARMMAKAPLDVVMAGTMFFLETQKRMQQAQNEPKDPFNDLGL